MRVPERRLRSGASSGGRRGSVLTFWLCCLRRAAPDGEAVRRPGVLGARAESGYVGGREGVISGLRSLRSRRRHSPQRKFWPLQTREPRVGQHRACPSSSTLAWAD